MNNEAVLNIIIKAVDQATQTTEAVTASVKKTGNQINDTSVQLSDVNKKAAVALGVVGAGLTAFAKSATDFTVQYVKDSTQLSRTIGTTIDDASRLVFAFSKFNLSVDDVSGSLGIFSKNIASATGDSEKNRAAIEKLNAQIADTEFKLKATNNEIAKNGDKTGALGIVVQNLKADLSVLHDQLETTGTAFDRLGISTVDTNGTQKDFNALLLEVSDKFKSMPDGIDKTALSMELFGRSGKDMIKVLNLGSQGIQDLEAQADKLGLTLTPNTIGKVQAYIASQKLLKENTDAVKLSVGTLTAPVLTNLNNKLSEVIGRLNGSSDGVKNLTANVLAFGGPAAGALAAVLGVAANIAQVGAGLVAAISGWVLAIVAYIAAVGLLIAKWDELPGVVKIALVTITGPLGEMIALWQIFGDWLTNKIPAAVEAAFNWIVAKAMWLKDNFWVVVGGIIGFFATLPITLPIFITEAMIRIVSFILSFKWSDIFSGIWQGMQWVWDRVIDTVVSAWHYIHNLEWGNLFTGIGKSLANGLISLIEGALKGALKGLPGNIENSIHFPRFATGVTNFAGGVAEVGERGRELVYLPAGSSVIPNGRTERILAQAGNGGTPSNTTINITNNNEFKRDSDPIAFARMQAFELARP